MSWLNKLKLTISKVLIIKLLAIILLASFFGIKKSTDKSINIPAPSPILSEDFLPRWGTKQKASWAFIIKSWFVYYLY